MKTIRSTTGTKEIRREKDLVAANLVKSGMYEYCPKKEWKNLQKKEQ